MPLVRIDLREGKSKEYRVAVGAAVHRAMVEILGVPARDHFQVITEHSPENLIYDPNYLDIPRTDDVIFIQVFLSSGRTREIKQSFYKRTSELLHEKPGVRLQDVAINLIANEREDWSFGNGEAQYVVLPKEQWK
jgi:4-oxalocrotonate tautomerase